jgi:hypothetical protein
MSTHRLINKGGESDAAFVAECGASEFVAQVPYPCHQATA